MKAVFAALALCFVSSAALANDGGIAAIKVDQIKMRETAIKEGKEVIVKKIVNPSYTIIIEGGEAAKLQKILPSSVTVLTAMQPEIKKDYDESFKALGIYSEKTAQASAKIVSINCSDAELKEASADGKYKVVKTGKSVCTITINGGISDSDPADHFGDAQEFNPKTCQ